MNKDKVPDEHYDFNDFLYTTEHICESKTGIGHYMVIVQMDHIL